LDHAFRNCSSLQQIRIPVSVVECGKRLFQNCLSLETVYVPQPQEATSGLEFGTSFLGSNLSPGIEVEEYNKQ